MINFNQAFKAMKKDEFFKVLKVNPSDATIRYNLKEDNIIVQLNLKNPKFLQTFGSNCSVCGADGKYFLFFKNGDIKLYAVSNFGMELEISIFNRKPYCPTCKGIKTSRLNPTLKKVK